ncbi:MAG: hypothetical protein HOD85_06285 [Deltaproteobacteria bacterium]|nr:hypothetical protein [Deltaproteobacteria bacterium]
MSFLSTSFIDQRASIITEDGYPEYYTIDSVSGEVHEFKSLITDNPIEDGSNISDHQTLLPLTITLNGFFTDTPISKNNPFNSLLNSSEGRGRDMWSSLVAIRDQKKKFVLVTGIKAYKNLLFEELSAQRAAGDGQKVNFSAKIRNVIITNPVSFSGFAEVAFDVEHSVMGLISLGAVSPVALV